MDSGDTINELEQHILNSLMLLGKNAYGMTVQEKLEELRDGRSVSLGSIYTTLDTLERRGYVRSWFSDPTPERAGRVKRFFEITGSGEMALRHSHRVPAMGGVWKEIGGVA